MIGSTVSHYRIVAKLGEGGMGVVYKAEDTRLERLVALKFLSGQLLDEADRLRFAGEARAAARVQHPNICPIYEISEYEGQLFFAMAFVDGETISQLTRKGPLAVARALGIAIQVYDGLEAAHRQGVVHRDIKSANIAVDHNGQAWILDFGLALRPGGERMTVTGRLLGTPAYMSPEQAQGLAVDHRTDIWSMAIVLFEMLTGKRPFEQSTQLSVLYAIVNQTPPAVTGIREDIPRTLEAFLQKALAKNPEERWKSAAEAAAELRRILSVPLDRTVTLGTAPLTAAAPSTAPAPPPTNSTRRWILAAGLGGAAAAIAAAGYFGFHKESLPEEKRIAVLPLTVAGNDDALRVIADGVVETLTSKLTQIEEFQGKLMVVPASEIRNRKIDSAEAARRIYGANLVLSGSAQRWSDTRIEFRQNLVDTATASQIDSRTFEFNSAKPIELRDRVVDGTVRLLALKVSPALAKSMKEGETSQPGAYEAYLKGAGYLFRHDLEGNVDRAIRSLTEATQLDPRYPLALTTLGAAQWMKVKFRPDKKEAERALESVQAAIRLDPKLVQAHIRLAEIYSETDRAPEAIQEAQLALSLAPENAEAYRVLGQANNKAGRYNEAEQAYREAVKRQPKDWFGLFSLGLFYSNQHRPREARNAWEEALKLTPDNEILHRNLAILDMDEGRFREASQRIQQTLRFAPTSRTYTTLGFAYYYQRRYAEAADALNRSKELNDKAYRAWGNLGTVYRHLPGMESKAREAFRKAIDLASEDLAVHKRDDNTFANLAEYWAKLGNKAEALQAVNRISPAKRVDFADRIVLAYELTGDRKRAVETVKSIPPGDPSLVFIRKDPDLEPLWLDPSLSRPGS